MEKDTATLTDSMTIEPLTSYEKEQGNAKNMKINSILISQPKPENTKSPYFDLADKYKIKVDFRKFIQVEGVDAITFRQDRIDLAEHTGVVLTSRNAVDHFFRMCKEMRHDVPDTMKYFCTNEAIAYYLQNYVQYRKRKIFHGQKNIVDLKEAFAKNKNEKLLLPVSNISNDRIPNQLKEFGLDFTVATLYKTVASDLSDLANVNYDLLVFFSPSGIESLFKNFPDFKQNNTKIAVWGNTTAKAVTDAGLRIDIQAPTPETPSMSMAIEQHIKA